MGWLSVLLSVIAAILFYRTEHTVLMILAILVSVVCFWSWGIMHNFALVQSRYRPGYTGRFFDITNDEADAVPDWITWVNIIFTVVGLGFLIAGAVFVYT